MFRFTELVLVTLVLFNLTFQAASMETETSLRSQLVNKISIQLNKCRVWFSIYYSFVVKAEIVDKLSFQAKKIDKLEKLIATKMPESVGQLSNVFPDTERGSSPSDPPTSCIDLQNLNHCLNGYYTVKNVKTNTLDTVYCNFNGNTDMANQTWIGAMDVKTQQVLFSVKRTTNYNSPKSVIPFQKEILNIGNAMNTSSGIFTAPVSGTYYFAFSALKLDAATPNTYIFFQKNGVTLTATYSNNVNGNLEYNTLGTQILLNLKAGDYVNLYLNSGALFDSSAVQDSYTVFSGWLESQDLAVP